MKNSKGYLLIKPGSLRINPAKAILKLQDSISSKVFPISPSLVTRKEDSISQVITDLLDVLLPNNIFANSCFQMTEIHLNPKIASYCINSFCKEIQ